MRIVFMGTPDFAVPSLQILLDHGYDIPAVVTAPDKPGGRQGVQQSAVKKFALERNLKILQPEKLKNSEFLDELRVLKADLQVVVAFRMLPEVVWNMPPLGTMNLHGSLLPQYRGAAPINWAIINGDTQTGLTTFLLKHEIDTGDLLEQAIVPISENDTAGELHDRMMHVGADLLLHSVQALENGALQPRPQEPSVVSHAPKIHTDTCRIDFNQSAKRVHDFIRGLSPYPGAWTELDGKTLKIYKTFMCKDDSNHIPGTYFSDGKSRLFVGVQDGCLEILELQMEGKKRMTARDFLNGYRL